MNQVRLFSCFIWLQLLMVCTLQSPTGRYNASTSVPSSSKTDGGVHRPPNVSKPTPCSLGQRLRELKMDRLPTPEEMATFPFEKLILLRPSDMTPLTAKKYEAALVSHPQIYEKLLPLLTNLAEVDLKAVRDVLDQLRAIPQNPTPEWLRRYTGAMKWYLRRRNVPIKTILAVMDYSGYLRTGASRRKSALKFIRKSDPKVAKEKKRAVMRKLRAKERLFQSQRKAAGLPARFVMPNRILKDEEGNFVDPLVLEQYAYDNCRHHYLTENKYGRELKKLMEKNDYPEEWTEEVLAARYRRNWHTYRPANNRRMDVTAPSSSFKPGLDTSSSIYHTGKDTWATEVMEGPPATAYNIARALNINNI